MPRLLLLLVLLLPSRPWAAGEGSPEEREQKEAGDRLRGEAVSRPGTAGAAATPTAIPPPTSTLGASYRSAPPIIVAPVPASTPPPAPNASRTAEEKIAQGDRLLAAGQERPALFAYQDAVYQDPSSVGAHMKLAELYVRLHHVEQAIEQWEIVLALDPGNEGARRDLEAARAGRARPASAPATAAEPGRPRVYKITPEEAPSPPAAGSAASPRP